MNIILACQKSGYLRELLRAQGHSAYTCDLEPAEDGTSVAHYTGDIFNVLKQTSGYWHCMIAMPECRFLCSSGQHRTGKPGQRTGEDVETAVRFFLALANAPIEHKAIENSVGIMSTRYRKPDQIIHPHQFGDDASKATCLWLENFPKVRFGLDGVPPRMVCQGCKRTLCEKEYGKRTCYYCSGRVLPRWGNQTDTGQNRLAPSPTRSADRARTFPGIARALAAAVANIRKPA